MRYNRSVLDVQATERVLVSTICNFSVGTVSPLSNSTASSPTNYGAKSVDDDELSNLKKRTQAMQCGTVERKIGIREWRRLREFPREH